MPKGAAIHDFPCLFQWEAKKLHNTGGGAYTRNRRHRPDKLGARRGRARGKGSLDFAPFPFAVPVSNRYDLAEVPQRTDEAEARVLARAAVHDEDFAGPVEEPGFACVFCCCAPLISST